jgi:hypothetical protein
MAASFLTAALDGGEWSASCCCCFTTIETARFPLYRRLGRPQSRAGLHGEKKNLWPLMRIESQLLSCLKGTYGTM